MNKTRYDFIGGMFLELDDLEFEQLGIRQGFEGLLSFFANTSLASESFIISGTNVVLSGGNFNVSPGFIAFKGEVMAVVAHSIPDNAAHVFFWDIDITFDPAGTEDFEDSSTKDTYEIRRVKLKSLVAPPVDIMFFDRLKPSDPSLTLNKLVIRKQFSEGINTTGTFYKTLSVAIGAWDMPATGSITLQTPAGITLSKIREVDVMIFNNEPIDTFEFTVQQLSRAGSINFAVEQAEMVLRRDSPGFFNNAVYSGGGNRGFITISFIP